MKKQQVQHTMEHVEGNYSDALEKHFPAHDRHTIKVGEVTVFGCESIKDAEKLLADHPYHG